jgi:hypothetical protein
MSPCYMFFPARRKMNLRASLTAESRACALLYAGPIIPTPRGAIVYVQVMIDVEQGVSMKGPRSGKSVGPSATTLPT